MIILILLLFVFNAKTANPPWGFWAHKRINKMALFTLPEELFGYYKPFVGYIEEHAVDPDKRRYAIAAEAPRHYIDFEFYGLPLDSIPHKWSDAVAKYTEDSLNAHGIVPWYVQLMMYRLEDAFKLKDANKILKITAEIGHYIADAHVPLHTTENYNGQLTNQKGIHGFWESRIPELIGDDYDYFVGKADYIINVRDKIWEIILKSNELSDSVLNLEAELNAQFPSDRKYSYETRGQTTIRTYSREYSLAYNELINNMVERRMRETIINLGSFWLTAWINAGKPNLTGIEMKPLTAEEIKEEEAIENNYRTKDKMKGRQEE